MKVDNKTIVLTGAGSGIGRELTFALLEKGARVAAVDINETALKETQKLAGDKGKNMSLHLLSISDRAAVEALPEQVLAVHKQVDGLINNAGIIQPFVRVNDLEYATIKRVVDVNFYGTLYMIKAFLPYLLKRPEAHIVNVSSMGGFLPVPGQSVYGATKAAVKLLTEGLHSELVETAVRVTLVFPGAIATNISDNSGVKAPRQADSGKKSKFHPMASDKAAAAIIKGMEKNKARVMVGKDAKFMLKLYTTSPSFARNFIRKQMKELLD
ncbi:MAG: SDR family NAD(P)-dependent oxidoreductase [Candidatus Neomarinimicrobiota bacterium]